MQGTVASYEADDQRGTVLLDDGVELPFSAGALNGTGLRLLRRGQRVRLSVMGSGPDATVTGLQILTMS